MSHDKARHLKDFISRTDRILFEEWDPIGINHILEASDEYSGYAPKLLGIAIRGNAESVADQLHLISSEYMCLKGVPRQYHLKIAQQLVEMASDFDWD